MTTPIAHLTEQERALYRARLADAHRHQPTLAKSPEWRDELRARIVAERHP